MGIGSGTSTIGDGVFRTGSAGGYGNYRYPVAQASPGGTFTMSGFAAHANQHFDLLGRIQTAAHSRRPRAHGAHWSCRRRLRGAQRSALQTRVDGDPTLTRSGDFAGTPAYVSPEQL